MSEQRDNQRVTPDGMPEGGMQIVPAGHQAQRPLPKTMGKVFGLGWCVVGGATMAVGTIVPCFFVGATFGCAVGPLLGLPAGFAAAIGLVCVFCGAVNCPLASILLAVELFDSADIVYFALACGLAYMLSGYFGLYSSQKIMYSKLKAEFINIHAR